MDILFAPLVKVDFNHNYFPGGIFSGFEVNIAADTRRLMADEGFVIKMFKGGFCILYDEFVAGRVRTREEILNSKIRFEFTLTLTDPQFLNYTDSVPDQINTSIYYFVNSAQKPGLLHVLDFVSAADLHKYWYFKETFVQRPFAKLELIMIPGMPAEYAIKFNSRATTLRYILINKELNDLKNMSVINVRSGEVFCEPSKVTLPDQTVVNGFLSTSPVVLRQIPDKDNILQLVQNYKQGFHNHKILVRALPFPDAKKLSPIAKPKNISTQISDIFI